MLPGPREDRNIDADVKETFHRSGRHCLVTCPVGLLRRSLPGPRRGPLRSGRAIFIRKKILVCGKGHGSADRLEWAGQGLVEKEPRVNLVGEQAFFCLIPICLRSCIVFLSAGMNLNLREYKRHVEGHGLILLDRRQNESRSLVAPFSHLHLFNRSHVSPPPPSLHIISAQ